MSEIWPFDVQQRLVFAPRSRSDPSVHILMPFESRFSPVADLIRATMEKVFDGLRKNSRSRRLTSTDLIGWPPLA